MDENTNNNLSTSRTSTVLRQMKEGIDTWINKIELKLWNKFIRAILCCGTWYVLAYNFIAPLFKSTFLIADNGSIFMLYVITILIWFILYNLYGIIIKLLLYVFS